MVHARFLMVLALVWACDDGNSSEPAGDAAGDAMTPAPDGARPDGARPDGALPDSAPPDGALPDAGPDATPPDAGPDPMWMCQRPAGEDSPFLKQIGCFDDFVFLASEPLDAAIPGARSVKTVIDRVDGDALYFQNTHLYAIHWAFASAHLSGRGLPVVPMLPAFNASEYSSPARRFMLGSITYYEGPGIFAYEIAPYDAADGAMIASAYQKISENSYFGDQLFFHPTSVAQERLVLPPEVKIVTTDELFAGIDYQPLNFAESLGRLRFLRAADLGTDYLSFRDIAVLDEVPNDISVCLGIITQAFQTPLSHVNVLSRNRGTPNMGLRGAFDNAELRALEGRWVRLVVGPLDYTIEEVTQAEADAWWEANRPAGIQLPGINLEITELLDLEDALDLSNPDLKDAIKTTTRAFGGKAAHYAALSHIEDLPVEPAFGVPLFYYFQFMEQNGFDDRVRALLADPAFQADPAVRDRELGLLRADMEEAPLDEAFHTALIAKIRAKYGAGRVRIRFRSSTNAEDLDGFTGAGLYESKTGDPDDPEDPVDQSVRDVWASVWNFRAFEERSYRSIDHLGVGMALLVHKAFPDEEANGVALTANPFDPEGLEPAFYVNVQVGEISVVQPPAGVSTESFLYFFERADQPVAYLSRSNQVPEDQRVLTAAQTFALGEALQRMRTFFTPAYGAGRTWWAMDVEFKFDGPAGEAPTLFIKQARPYQ